MQPINLSEVLGIVFGMSAVLIPVAGFTLKFALMPLVVAYGRARGSGGSGPDSERLERRVLELEQQLRLLEDREAVRSVLPLDVGSLLRPRTRS